MSLFLPTKVIQVFDQYSWYSFKISPASLGGFDTSEHLKGNVTVYHCSVPQSLIVVLLRSFKKLQTFFYYAPVVYLSLSSLCRYTDSSERNGGKTLDVEWKEGLQKPA